MPKRRQSSATGDESAESVLARLKPDEASTVLNQLLENHPELRSETEKIAAARISTPSINDIASDVFAAVTDVDPEALNERAGSHSWGYVEPNEAAGELLEEAIEEWTGDMTRQSELGFGAAAEAICAGIIGGLYRARNVESDGALGWDPDFPALRAEQIVKELIGQSKPDDKPAMARRLVAVLVEEAPEWADIIQKAAAR